MTGERLAVTVIVPVRNGRRYLREVLDAIDRQQLDADVQTLVVDSGSTDGSPEIARDLRAELIEIPSEEFGHGRTRDLAASHARGDVIVFLTQDATPSTDAWLGQLIEPLDGDARVGLSFGPHLPRPGASPIIARELVELFMSFSPHGRVRIDERLERGDPAAGFFSNVNSAILRECWAEVRFRDLAYAEDQAFARDAFKLGWRKAYVPGAAVLHSHDYSFMEFMRRYFDEYRGLREAAGHVEPLRGRTLPGTIRRQVSRDLEFMRESGWGGGARLIGALRSVRHHSGRYVFAVLGSRAQKLPPRARSRLSLEGRRNGPGARADGVARGRVTRASPSWPYRDVADYFELGATPLTAPAPTASDALDIAWIAPPLRAGSGGHATLFTIVRELERRGHRCSIWIHDPEGGSPGEKRIRAEIRDSFAPIEGQVRVGFDRWSGAQVALATGWLTAYAVARLPDCLLKAYLVQDYEPDFYPQSAERLWAEETYRMGFPCLAASPWLGELLGSRFGLVSETFDLGVDFGVYRPLSLQRSPDTIAFYARSATPRRGTQLGLMALAEVVRSRPQTRVVVFGDAAPPSAPFDYEFQGMLAPGDLGRLYCSAAVGLVISLSNYSLVPKEMMACGLAVVDVEHPSAQSVFGRHPEVIALADPDPRSIAERVLALLDAPDARERQAQGGLDFTRHFTWSRAAEQVEHALTKWLPTGAP